MLPKSIFWSLLIFVCAVALWRGKRDEWIAALVCAGGSFATMLVGSISGEPLTGVETGVMIVDLAALAIFTGLALVSQRFWPLWVAGFQLASSMAHMLMALNAELVPRAYAAAERFWIYPIFLVIIIGAMRTKSYAERPEDSLTY